MHIKLTFEKILIIFAVLLILLGIGYVLNRNNSVTNDRHNSQEDSLRLELMKTQKQLYDAQQNIELNKNKPEPSQEEKEEQMIKDQKKLELNHPLDFLKINYSHSYRILLGMEEFKGEIHNKSTYATFMNVVIRITFLSKTKTAIQTKLFTIYEYVGPGEFKPFSIQTEGPEGYRSHRLEIIRAVPYQD